MGNRPGGYRPERSDRSIRLDLGWLNYFGPSRLVRPSVFTEFRQHGIPYVFFTSVHSVGGTELVKIPRNYTEFRVADVRIVPQNFAKFSLCIYIVTSIFFKKTNENVRFFIF
jgi:hypothetical protein